MFVVVFVFVFVVVFVVVFVFLCGCACQHRDLHSQALVAAPPPTASSFFVCLCLMRPRTATRLMCPSIKRTCAKRPPCPRFSLPARSATVCDSHKTNKQTSKQTSKRRQRTGGHASCFFFFFFFFFWSFSLSLSSLVLTIPPSFFLFPRRCFNVCVVLCSTCSKSLCLPLSQLPSKSLSTSKPSLPISLKSMCVFAPNTRSRSRSHTYTYLCFGLHVEACLFCP